MGKNRYTLVKSFQGGIGGSGGDLSKNASGEGGWGKNQTEKNDYGRQIVEKESPYGEVSTNTRKTRGQKKKEQVLQGQTKGRKKNTERG